MDKKKKNVGNIVAMAVMVLVGVACGIFAAREWFGGAEQGMSTGQEIIRIVALLIFLYLGIFLQSIIHEAGHLVFGLLSGYSFSSFRIGSLMLIKKQRKLEWKRYSLTGTAGQCLMVPPSESLEKIPYILYNMGGVIANVVVSLLLIWIGKLMDSSGLLSGFCIITAFVGIGAALINGVPLHMGTIDNDGANTVSISQSDQAKRCFVNQMLMNAYITKGMRLKDMPDMWFRIPDEESRKNGLCASIGVLACNRAIDQINFETARKLGHQMMEEDNGLVGIQKLMLQAEMMYCELIGENRPEEIEHMNTKDLKKFLKAMKKNPSILRLQYTYHLLAEHEEAKAKEDLEMFEKVALTYPNDCEIEGERELIAHARKVFDQRKSDNE